MAELGRGSRLTRLLAVLSVVAILVHLFGLYRSTGPSPGWFPDADKVEHLVGFAAPVSLLLLTGMSRRRQHRDDPSTGRPWDRYPVMVLAIFAAHAVVSELVQHFFYRDRTGDPADALADLCGVALGWGVARLLGPRVMAMTGAATSSGASLSRSNA